MPELLREGPPLPTFTLPPVIGGPPLRYASLLRRHRIGVLILSDKPVAGDNGRTWLANARQYASDFAERDLTVLVVAQRPEQIKEAERLPSPFVLLRDQNGTVSAKLGSGPAFYLVGKDTGVKQSTRIAPRLSELWAQIDSMPMRRQEMRREGQTLWRRGMNRRIRFEQMAAQFAKDHTCFH